MLSPGQYLRKRRDAAGLSVVGVAQALVALPISRRPIGDGEVGDLAAFIVQIEQDRVALTRRHIDLLREVFRFDKTVVIDLCCGRAPQLCRGCACSWMDACIGDAGACSWSDHDAELCTACERLLGAEAEAAPAIAAFADWPDAPLPEGASA